MAFYKARFEEFSLDVGKYRIETDQEAYEKEGIVAVMVDTSSGEIMGIIQPDLWGCIRLTKDLLMNKCRFEVLLGEESSFFVPVDEEIITPAFKHRMVTFIGQIESFIGRIKRCEK